MPLTFFKINGLDNGSNDIMVGVIIQILINKSRKNADDRTIYTDFSMPFKKIWELSLNHTSFSFFHLFFTLILDANATIEKQ